MRTLTHASRWRLLRGAGVVAALLFLSGPSSGCSATNPGACTEIGCSSGLRVVVRNPPPPPYSIEVEPLGSNSVRFVRHCTTTTTCDGTAFFTDFLPDQANVYVIAGTDTTRRSVGGIEYVEHQPNGPRCPPTCRTAEILFPE